MNRRHTLANKYMLLAMIIIAMLVMSGCRTRITNNSEVSNIHYDEDGFLSELYEMRRDELGLSTAERPILPDLGSTDSDDDDFDNSEDENALQNYEPEPEEPYVEPQQNNTNTNTNTNTNRGTTTQRSTTPRRTTPTTTPTQEVTVTFNPGKEGKIDGKKKGESTKKTVKKNSSVTPPEATREGYTLTEWKSSDGKTSIKPGSSKTVSKNESFTAQWKKKKEEGGDTPTPTVEKWNIAFNTDGGTAIDSDAVEKGKKFRLPSAPKKDGYIFNSWKLEDGSTHDPGDEIDITNDTTITALWDPTAETTWTEKFDAEKENPDIAEVLVTMPEKDDKGVELDFVSACKAAEAQGAEDPEVVVVFAKTKDVEAKWKELNEAKDSDDSPLYEGMLIVVISDTAKGDKYSLAYQIKLMKILHSNSELDIDTAAQELLGVSDADDIIIKAKLQETESESE